MTAQKKDHRGRKHILYFADFARRKLILAKCMGGILDEETEDRTFVDRCKISREDMSVVICTESKKELRQ